MIIYAKLTLKTGTKTRISNEVILDSAKFFKGEEIIKKEIIKELGEPNEQLTRLQYEQIQNPNNSTV